MSAPKNGQGATTGAQYAPYLPFERKKVSSSEITAPSRRVSGGCADLPLAMEFTKRRISKGAFADTTGWYVLGGYRFGKLLPYVVFSKLNVDDVNSSAPATLGPLRPTVVALQSGQYVAQRTTAVGLRWDALRNMDVKVQFDHIKKPANSNGLFLVENPTAAADQAFQGAKKNINVISLAVDFVF